MGYGRTGQVETVTDTTGTRDLVYDPAKPWRLTAEAHADFYGSRVLTRLYDETGTIGSVRGFQLGATAGSNSDLEQTFGFTTVGRFETLTSNRLGNTVPSRTFRYSYLANAALLQSLAIDQGAGPGGHPFTITRDYESQRDLVQARDSKWSTDLRTGYSYVSDERGLRTKVVQSGSAFSDYGDVTAQQFTYNGRGELTGAIGYLGSDITLPAKQLPGRRHEYAYDPAGNRQWSNRTGVTALRDDYTTNALNQYVTRENNTVPVSGTAEPDTGGPGGVAVAVAGGATTPVPAGRQGRYWNDEVAVTNAAGPWRGPLAIYAVKRSTGSGDLFKVESRMAEIAAVLQSFAYDLDGNLTSDGLVDYTWDAENRLVRMETSLAARTAGFPHRELTFRYDYLGRRVQKRVVDVTQSQELSCRRFLYDGWNLIAEYAAPGGTTCGTLLRSYTWGLDIVNTLSSAGGVGALLQIADHPTAQTYLPTYDGNGNVVALVNATSGAVAAAYEYSPFGEPLRAQTLDPVVADNPFRFSTKYTDGETGFVYYGRRFYSPSQGRFLGRDPIEEAGGLNLYGFVSNDPINDWDVLGCDGVTEHQSVAADGTRFMSYMASVTDVLGQLRQWNFSSEADAHNWLNAWATKDAGILKPYIQQMANEAFATPANITVQFLQTIPGISNTLRSLYPTLVGASDDDSDDAFFSRVISTIDPVLIYAQITGGRNPVVLDTLTVGFKGAQFLGGWNGDNDAFVNWVHQLPGQIIYDSPVILPGNVGAANRRIREFLKINPIGRINIIGYSAGGEQAVQLVTALAAQKIPVGTLITIDPHFRRSGSDDANFSIPTGAVAQALNFFQRNPLGTYNKYLGSAVKGADNFDLTGLRPNGPGDSLVEHSDIVRFLLTPGGYPGYMNYQLAIYNALGLPPPPRR